MVGKWPNRCWVRQANADDDSGMTSLEAASRRVAQHISIRLDDRLGLRPRLQHISQHISQHIVNGKLCAVAPVRTYASSTAVQHFHIVL
jgi:hypothetical protein